MKKNYPRLFVQRSYLLLSVVFLLLGKLAICQTETHDFITYDTVLRFSQYGGSEPYWTLRISRPANMFSATSADTASRPALITMPGAGEIGTDTSVLANYGPHYWLRNGWDGGVVLGNGTHYPILVTIITSSANVRPWYLLELMDYLLNHYHIKRNSVHVAGLSMGSWTWGRFLTFRDCTNPDTSQAMIKSYVALQAVARDSFSVCTPFSWARMGHWAKTYGGTFFGLEGTHDTRDEWNVRNAMDDSIPGKAYFAYENIGGGAHCCWNSMYDPSQYDWNCTGTVTNPNIDSNASHPNSMGTYSGGSIFQWMLRQGDTTLVGSGTIPLQANAGTDRTLYWPSANDTLLYAAADSLDGTLSTGDIQSYQWNFVSGPDTPSIANDTVAFTSVTNLHTGSYVFSLTVTDSSSTSIDSVVIQVLPDSYQPPVADAGADDTVYLPLSTDTLDATNSTGGSLTYAWTQVSGPDTLVITNVDSAIAYVSGLQEGDYTVSLTVSNNGGSDTDTMIIHVQPEPNAAPIANAGANQSVILPQDSVLLYGSGTDADGTVVSYSWTMISGSGATIQSPDSATTLITGLSAGTFVFSLEVTDDDGATGADAVTITVTDTSIYVTKKVNVNIYGGTNPYNDSTWNNWNASSTGSALKDSLNLEDGSLSPFHAKLSNTTNMVDNGASYGGTMCPPEVLRYGGYSTSYRSLTLTGLDSSKKYNLHFFASRSGTGNNTNFLIGDDTINVVTDNNLSNSVDYYNLSPSHDTILVYFDRGAGGTYNYLNGFVLEENGEAPANEPPVADAGSDSLLVYLPQDTALLNGSGTDTDGTITNYHWTLTVGSGPTIVQPDSASTSITGLTQGTYLFQLQVTDNDGASAYDSVWVMVYADTTPLITHRVNINLYDGIHPYNDSTWNNWDLSISTGSTTIDSLSYEDGSLSPVHISLPTTTSFADNGADYGGTMCPPEVLRYASYLTSYRRLLITGLDSSKTYNLEFYASRANTGNNTDFLIGSDTINIVTDSNLSNAAIYENIAPSHDTIEVLFARGTGGTYNYLNGFMIEESGDTSARKIPAASQGTITIANEIQNSFTLYPNPASGAVRLNLSNKLTGTVKVTITSQVGALISSFQFNKQAPLFSPVLSTTGLSRGIYFITVDMQGYHSVKRLIKL